MLVKTNTADFADKRSQQLKEIARIEKLPRPEKWHAIRDFTLKLHPGYIPAEIDFIAAVKDIRDSNLNKFGSNKQASFRHMMKLPQYIYTALVTLDPQLQAEMSSKNQDEQMKIVKQLYKAFPMYRACEVL